MKKLTIRIPQDRGPEGLYDRIRYPAGEIQVRLTKKGLKACERREAYEIVANPIPDIVELAQLKDALDAVGYDSKAGRSQWWSRSLFLPYMPYARADRRFVPGDCEGLRVWANLIKALRFNTVWTFDAHSEVAHEAFGNLANLKPTDRTTDQIQPIIRKLGRRGLALVLPDAGAAIRYPETARYSLPEILGVKHRDAKTGGLSGFGILPGDTGKAERAQKALILDDICDGGGTFIGLAEALHRINPELKLYLYVSHGIFSKGRAGLLKHFKQIFTSQYSIQPDKDLMSRIYCGIKS